jgi:hypothetical protein
MTASSGDPCSAAVRRAAGTKLMDAVKLQAKAGNNSVVSFAECAGTKVREGATCRVEALLVWAMQMAVKLKQGCLQ